MAAAAGSGAEAATAARLEGAEGEEETAAAPAAEDEEDGEEDGGRAGKATGAAAAAGGEAGGGESEEDEEEEGEDVFEVEKILDVKSEGVSARVASTGPRGAREKSNPVRGALWTALCRGALCAWFRIQSPQLKLSLY